MSPDLNDRRVKVDATIIRRSWPKKLVYSKLLILTDNKMKVKLKSFNLTVNLENTAIVCTIFLITKHFMNTLETLNLNFVLKRWGGSILRIKFTE